MRDSELFGGSQEGAWHKRVFPESSRFSWILSFVATEISERFFSRTNGAEINHSALFEGALGNVNKSVGLLVLEALIETVTKAICQGSEGNEILRVFGGDPLCSVLAEGSGGNEELDMGMVNQGA